MRSDVLFALSLCEEGSSWSRARLIVYNASLSVNFCEKNVLGVFYCMSRPVCGGIDTELSIRREKISLLFINFALS